MALLLGLLACLAGRVSAADPPAAAAGDDDPFADELNPFGGKPKPATPQPKPPSVVPPPTETELEPAPKPAPRPAPQSAPDAMPAPPGRPKPPLPVPFPDADAPVMPGGRMPAQRVRPLPSDAAAEPDAWEPSPAEKIVAEAEKLDNAGDLVGARAKLREAIKADPRFTIAYLALGVVARKLGDYEAAVDACSRGLAISPDEPELYLRRGIAWFHLGLYGIALEDFDEAAGLAGFEDARPELWRGLTLIELDRPLEAINAYAASIRRDRGFALAYVNRGLAYLSTGEPRKAELDFDQVIRQNPRDARAWFNRGVAQARQGRFAAAVSSYTEALEHDPSLEAARRNLAAARTALGR